ncbi:MAG: ABC transporter substrate-binding protein [Anaerolineales bacterium]|nr:ABC transporter substrate-binding protein [Anaerolineales bacterium]
MPDVPPATRSSCFSNDHTHRWAGRACDYEWRGAELHHLIGSINTEILFAVGAGAQVIGRDAYSDYPAEALDVADIGDTYAGLNTELIVSLKPDLILAAEINTAEQVKALEDLGLTVYYLKGKHIGRNVYQP